MSKVGIRQGPGERWTAQRRDSAGKLHSRGPFDFEEEAVFASDMMRAAVVEGAPVPSTAQIKAVMPDLAGGRERPLTMRERKRLYINLPKS